MAINALPNVSIGGSNQLFGGFIYNLSLQVAAGLEGENVTTLTVDIASESGQYLIGQSDLNLDQPYIVQINNFQIPMYLKAYRNVISTKGNILQATFIDDSFKLDRYWVGLNKHVWDLDPVTNPTQTDGNGQPKPNYLIVVGTEVHPCDYNWDGKATFQDIIDPCDPCITPEIMNLSPVGTVGNAQLQRTIMDCEEKTRLNIFDVQYDFDSFVQTVSQQTGIGFVNSNGSPVASPNPKFRQKYAGTLRSVIKAWCEDFGWTFFFSDNTVFIVDVTSVIQVTQTLQQYCPNVSEYSEENTLDGTVMGNVITHFRRPGQFRDYVCQDARWLLLSPYQAGNDFIVPNLAITNDIDPNAAGLCLYDPSLRDLYYWFIKYKNYDTTNIYPMSQFPELGLTVLSNPYQLNLPAQPAGSDDLAPNSPATALSFPANYPLNQDTSKSFLAHTSIYTPAQQAVYDALQKQPDFLKLFNLLAPKEQWAFAQNAGSYYFFIGLYDEILEKEHINDEREFASDFLGKYYIYQPPPSGTASVDETAFWEDTRIVTDETQCGRLELIDDGKLKFGSLNKGEDSITYYNAPASTVQGDINHYARLPWAKFLDIFRNSQGTAQNSPSYRYSNFKLLTVSVGGERFFPSPTQRIKDDADSTQSNFPIQDKDLIRQAHTYYLNHTIAKLDSTEQDVLAALLLGDQTIMKELSDSVQDTSKIFLFWGRTCSQDDFQYSQAPLWYHESQPPGYLFDGVPLNQRLDELDNTNEIVYKYPALRCKQMGRWYNLAPRYNFVTPAATFAYTAPCNVNYGVVLEKTKTTTIRTERMQLFFVEGNEPTSQTIAVHVNQLDIGNDDVKFRLLQQPSTCQYSKKLIQQLHQEQATNLNFEQTTPIVKKSFTIAGALPNIPSVAQGLMSIQMTIDRNEGLKSTYTFGTVLMKIPNQNVFNGLEFSSQKGYSVAITDQTTYKQIPSTQSNPGEPNESYNQL